MEPCQREARRWRGARCHESDAEVAGVELIGGMDLSRGCGRRMERGRDGWCERVRAGARAMNGGGAGEGGVCPAREGAQSAEQKGNTVVVRPNR